MSKFEPDDRVAYSQNFLRIIGPGYSKRRGTVARVARAGRVSRHVHVNWDGGLNLFIDRRNFQCDSTNAIIAAGALRKVAKRKQTVSSILQCWLRSMEANGQGHGEDLVAAFADASINGDDVDGMLGRLVLAGQIAPVEFCPSRSKAAFIGLHHQQNPTKPGAVATRSTKIADGGNFVPGQRTAFRFRPGPWE